MDTLETIHAFTLAPWDARVRTDVTAVPQSLDESGGSMQIAISGLARNGLDYIAHEQQNSDSYSQEPSTAVGPGLCGLNLQVDEKNAKEWQPDRYHLGLRQREEQIVGPA
ncbi:transposon I factor [Penicillium malachiteum]|uniref:transposon I factor n=1 Tax=Penicillium malachiteum TaxID=1324776 RepID=UPI00254963A6|nr:transposon I factor [Penicillium malachiteum]KAJ5715982.1 transposon I factor [Penicillium malachiteum]